MDLNHYLSTFSNLPYNLPSSWKHTIVPDFKNVIVPLTNYRPISILSNFSNIFDSVIQDSLFFSVETKCCEHAFIKPETTSSNLVTYLHHVNRFISSHRHGDVIHFNSLSRLYPTCCFYIKLVFWVLGMFRSFASIAICLADIRVLIFMGFFVCLLEFFFLFLKALFLGICSLTRYAK